MSAHHPDEPPAGTWVIGDGTYPYQRDTCPDVMHGAHWWSVDAHDFVTWRAIVTLHRQVHIATLDLIKKED